MTEEQWHVVDEVPGQLQAEIIRGFLEAQEIQVMLSQEGIGRVYGLTVGPAGRVQILVHARDLDRARQSLHDFHAGNQGTSDDPLENDQDDWT
jgi:hypothetical protein